MAVALMKAGDHLSLEFDPEDADAVRACIRERHPEAAGEPAGLATIIRFGGETFTYYDEWDDPCLISASARGDELLRAIYARLR